MIEWIGRVMAVGEKEFTVELTSLGDEKVPPLLADFPYSAFKTPAEPVEPGDLLHITPNEVKYLIDKKWTSADVERFSQEAQVRAALLEEIAQAYDESEQKATLTEQADEDESERKE